MPRFYLLILAVLVASPARAQPPASPASGQPLLGSTLTAAEIRDLPLSNNAQTVLETIQLETISSRISSGGLNIASAPQAGGFLNSWTQTQFRVGDIAITDPRAGGTPLLLPLFPFFDRVTTAVGAMGIDDNAPGLSMTLEPARPAKQWTRAVEGSLSGSGLTAAPPGGVPAVDRLRQWQEGSALISGPLTGRVGVAAGGSWRGLLHVAAPRMDAANDQAASGFAHVVFAASSRDEVRALGWAQQVSTPAFTDNAVHAQSTWERHDPAQLAWRVFAGYTARDRTAPLPTTLVVDSLVSDPVSDAFDNGSGSARRWTLGARVAPPVTRVFPTVGIDIEGARLHVAPSGIQQIRELVDGQPARVWTVQAGAATDDRHLTTIAAYAEQRVVVRRLTLDAGVRLDRVSAGADAAAAGIEWTTWLPRAMARWQVAETAGVSASAAYRRSAYQLPLNVLAIGDPAAPVADVDAWNGTTIGLPGQSAGGATAGPLIARVGPGTGGDATLTRIDPALRRPTTDELVLALQSRPMRGLQVELARVTKREQPLFGLVDTGVTAAEYSPFQLPDPSFLPGSPVGAPQVTAYNRPPGAYGRDRYLLTNRTDEPARSWALELTVKASTENFTFIGGGALTEAYGPAAAVGFLASENDQNVLGSLLVDRNTATAARGQLFQDRSHVVKMAGIYRFPRRVHLGAILRYQDGQPFARLVIAPALTQGPTAVRSYANGGSAFTYTATLDVRLQKAFTAGRAEVSAVADFYNITNLDNEVTEYIVTGPRFRAPTALQPPRTAVVGLRVSF